MFFMRCHKFFWNRFSLKFWYNCAQFSAMTKAPMICCCLVLIKICMRLFHHCQVVICQQIYGQIFRILGVQPWISESIHPVYFRAYLDFKPDLGVLQWFIIIVSRQTQIESAFPLPEFGVVLTFGAVSEHSCILCNQNLWNYLQRC